MIHADPSTVGGRSPCTPVRDPGFRHDYAPASVNGNTVVFIRKDGSLCFCTDFHHLNPCTKKDSYQLPRSQEALKSLVGAKHFSCLGLKSGLWQIKMDELST